MRRDPAAPVALTIGQGVVAYADPYTGRLLGRGDAGVRAFFRERHRLASLARRQRRVPGDRPRGHRRRQPRLPVPRPLGRLPLDPAHLGLARGEAGHLVPRRPPRQGARLQLAQHHRRLVGGPAGDRRRLGRRHLVSLGEQPGLPDRRRSAAGRAWRRGRRRSPPGAGRRRARREAGVARWSVRGRRRSARAAADARRGRRAGAVARRRLATALAHRPDVADHHAPPPGRAGADARLHDRRRRSRPAAVSRHADRRSRVRRGREVGRLRGQSRAAASSAPCSASRTPARCSACPARPSPASCRSAASSSSTPASPCRTAASSPGAPAVAGPSIRRRPGPPPDHRSPSGPSVSQSHDHHEDPYHVPPLALACSVHRPAAGPPSASSPHRPRSPAASPPRPSSCRPSSAPGTSSRCRRPGCATSATPRPT